MAFSLFGIPVSIRIWFLLFAVLLNPPRDWGRDSLIRTAVWVIVVVASVLVHELGHAAVFRIFGIRSAIDLYGLGGMTIPLDASGPLPPWKNILVSLAGPVAGLLLGVVTLVAALIWPPSTETFADELVRFLLFANFGWSVLNLLPLTPLDGGHVVQALVELAVGRDRAFVWVHRWSIVGGIGLAILALATSLPGAFIGLWAALGSWQALAAGNPWRAAPAPRAPPRTTDAATMNALLEHAWAAVFAGRAEEALARCRDVLATTDRPEVARQAIEISAWAHLERGDEEAALAALEHMPAGQSPSRLLAARLQMARGAITEGLRGLEEAFAAEPGPLSARVLAAAVAEHGNPKRFVELVRAAPAESLDAATLDTVSAQMFYAGSYDAAFALAALAFERHGRSEAAYNAACSLARAGRPDEGLDWLRRAIDAGFRDLAQVDADEDLAPLRSLAGYAEVRRRLEEASRSGSPPPSSPGGGSGG
ncbi:MAG: hypothetical protein RMK74_16895 [Myxococcales bacterium]|nr:hypothetical protein [Myxococcales bacterium]